MPSNDNILVALNLISPADLAYDEWVAVGMALHYEGYPVNVWQEWSKNDSRYKASEFERKWESFSDDRSETKTGAYIVYLAKERYGFTPQASLYDASDDLDWDIDLDNATQKEPESHDTSTKDVEDYSALIAQIDTHILDGKKFVVQPSQQSKAVECADFLQALFKPYTKIGVCLRVDEEGKPTTQGAYWHTVSEYLQLLQNGLIANAESRQKILDDTTITDKQTQLDTLDDKIMRATFGDYDAAYGAWICVNPLDGNGRKDENVVEYKYTVIECDNISIERQYRLLSVLRLPIAALTFSGGKSLHAIVHVDANDDYELYKRRVKFIHEVCTINGLTVDRANKNPARLTRLASVWRGDQLQCLVGTNIGEPDFLNWLSYWQKLLTDKLIEQIVPFTPLLHQNLPQLAPPIIDGVLRQGHKMFLAGISKGGKTYGLIQLAVCLAEGLSWFGFKCKQSSVLYCNFEIDERSFYCRVAMVYDALGVDKLHHTGNVFCWSLRGQTKRFKSLTEDIITVCQTRHIDVVILDPIYKVLEGDENKAQDATKFLHLLDVIASRSGASVIYSHHHSKGSQGDKNAIDRASGSGAFSRDADAIIDLLGVEMGNVRDGLVDEGVITASEKPYVQAYKVEMTLREFKKPEPIVVFWSHPRFIVDDKNRIPIKDKTPAEREQDKADEELANALVDADARDVEISRLRDIVRQYATELPDGRRGALVKSLTTDSEILFGKKISYQAIKKRYEKYKAEFVVYSYDKPIGSAVVLN